MQCLNSQGIGRVAKRLEGLGSAQAGREAESPPPGCGTGMLRCRRQRSIAEHYCDAEGNGASPNTIAP
eukprot:1267445-Prymnesium_polylepis.1